MAREVELLFLGTGGAVPRGRRQPSILISDWMGSRVLMDAGEGAQYWLFEKGVSPSEVTAILVSHPHGDHINGVAGLLMTMSLQGRRRKLLVVSTPESVDFMRETLEATETRLGFDVDFVAARGKGSIEVSGGGGDVLVAEWFPACHTVEALGFKLVWRLRARISYEKLASMGLRPGPWVRRVLRGETVYVEGYRVELRDIMGEGSKTFSIGYTGDTYPCESLVESLRGVDILIHDATLAGGLEEEARSRGHSTSVGAAMTAKEVSARLLVLTHISTRYEGFEARRLLSEARKRFPESVLAWDGMRIKVYL